MKEAILVLDEAGIDFKELKSRVDGVAKVKKAPALPSPQSSASSRSSVSGVVEKQQRRPHAIAWEVKNEEKMRCSILSSFVTDSVYLCVPSLLCIFDNKKIQLHSSFICKFCSL